MNQTNIPRCNSRYLKQELIFIANHDKFTQHESHTRYKSNRFMIKPHQLRFFQQDNHYSAVMHYIRTIEKISSQSKYIKNAPSELNYKNKINIFHKVINLYLQVNSIFQKHILSFNLFSMMSCYHDLSIFRHTNHKLSVFRN